MSKRFSRAAPSSTGSVNLTLAQPELTELFGCDVLLPVAEPIKDGSLVRPLSQICAAYFPRMDAASARLEDVLKPGIALIAPDMRSGMTFAVAGELLEMADSPPPLFRVGLGTSEDMLRHESDNARVPECPARLRRALAALEGHALAGPLLASMPRITPRCATLDEISAAHRRELYEGFVERGESLSRALHLPSDVYCSDDGSSSVAARTACGIVVDATEAVLTNELNSALCLVRPPGHHCSCSQPNGFCLINNVAVAALVAKQRHPGVRVAVVDVDVHHGEGTQRILEAHNDMLYVSLHRYDGGAFFPYCASEASSTYCGMHGNVVNVACDTDAYSSPGLHKVISDELMDKFFTDVVVPALSKFEPSVILVSCGFDAAYQDPLGRMAVVNGYGTLMEQLQDFAANRQIGLVVALEGGYNLDAVATNTLRVYMALAYGCSRGRLPAAVPPTWAEVRRKQLRQSPASNPSVGPDGAEDVGDLSTAAERGIPSDEHLKALHQEWVASTIAATVSAHKAFT
jgi:acetoin utilization deacetylase AcuC-like enzyme